MNHMSPYRLNVPNQGADISSGVSNPKKRRKNGQTNIQTPPNQQDLLPPPLSGYGDTIVASNPFDDCPSSMGMTVARNPNSMGMGSMPMGVNTMPMCRPMGAPPMSGMHHAHGMMIPGSRMNGPNIPPPGAMNGPPMGNMGPHMMPSPGGPIHGPVPGSMSSPLGNMGPSPMPGSMSGNGPINGPMMSPMGPMNNGAPMGSMNGPINNSPMNGPGGPINGIPANMNNQMNGMGGMNNSMNAHNHCNMNHNAGGGNFMMPMNNMYQKPLPVSAGKVYPADQPMVFNSQNPHAPPIYPCGVCHKEVHDNDQAILCESGCNFWFHRGCTGLTEAAYQLLTAEVYAEWVCDKCLSSKSIPLVKFKP